MPVLGLSVKNESITWLNRLKKKSRARFRLFVKKWFNWMMKKSRAFFGLSVRNQIKNHKVAEQVDEEIACPFQVICKEEDTLVKQVDEEMASCFRLSVRNKTIKWLNRLMKKSRARFRLFVKKSIKRLNKVMKKSCARFQVICKEEDTLVQQVDEEVTRPLFWGLSVRNKIKSHKLAEQDDEEMACLFQVICKGIRR